MRQSLECCGPGEDLDTDPSCFFVLNRFPRDAWVGASVADQRSDRPLECRRLHVSKFMEQVVIAFGNRSAG